ncbi:hypothetical protein [Ensifer adhaerens]|jgi:hypothetical protein|uniref:hypothetical protein n=1 Tax=Ensifer adhaerens TaxID=106592 RepID=UPI00202E2E6B|nr:hypothetical protein [Ensifer adhaerens]
MSSSNPEHCLHSDDLSLLVEVLAAAGYYGTTTTADPGGRLAATRFLIAALESGVDSHATPEAALAEPGTAAEFPRAPSRPAPYEQFRQAAVDRKTGSVPR